MSEAEKENPVISNEAVELLMNSIESKRNEYRKRASKWKNWFRVVIVGAAFASACAAVSPRIDYLNSEEPLTTKEKSILQSIDSPVERNLQEDNYLLKAEIEDMQLTSSIAALFAFAATILTSLIGLLDFESYWHANRQARHRLEALLVMVKHKPTAMREIEYNNYLNEFRSILLERADRISPAAFQVANDSQNKA